MSLIILINAIMSTVLTMSLAKIRGYYFALIFKAAQEGKNQLAAVDNFIAISDVADVGQKVWNT